jgi:transcriptional regulator with AAA-type ATPase domain
VVNIKLPPLTDRRDDIPFLASFFIEKYNQKYGMKVEGISQRAMNHIIGYEWSGNVRELENTIESSMVINSPKVIDIHHLPQEIREFKTRPEMISIKIGTSLEEVEKEVLIQTLKHRATSERAAELGINVRTIHRKMEEIRTTPVTGRRSDCLSDPSKKRAKSRSCRNRVREDGICRYSICKRRCHFFYFLWSCRSSKRRMKRQCFRGPWQHVSEMLDLTPPAKDWHEN